MKEEIEAAVLFITRLVMNNSSLEAKQVETFSEQLKLTLLTRFKNHWYLEDPNKGQAYRCIRINETERIDPVLESAAKNCQLEYADLRLPPELTLWVDPHEVTCRFGELKGSYCTLADFKKGRHSNRADSINIGDLLRKSETKKMAEMNKLLHAAGRRQKLHSQRGKPPTSSKSSKFFQSASSHSDRYHWVRGSVVKA